MFLQEAHVAGTQAPLRASTRCLLRVHGVAIPAIDRRLWPIVSTSQAGLVHTGHTDEGVGQLNDQLCSHSCHQPFAETPHSFVRRIQQLLGTELATAAVATYCWSLVLHVPQPASRVEGVSARPAGVARLVGTTTVRADEPCYAASPAA